MERLGLALPSALSKLHICFMVPKKHCGNSHDSHERKTFIVSIITNSSLADPLCFRELEPVAQVKLSGAARGLGAADSPGAAVRIEIPAGDSAVPLPTPRAGSSHAGGCLPAHKVPDSWFWALNFPSSIWGGGGLGGEQDTLQHPAEGAGICSTCWFPALGQHMPGLANGEGGLQEAVAGGILQVKNIPGSKVPISSTRCMLAFSTSVGALANQQGVGPMLTLARRKSFPLLRANSNALAKGYRCAGGPVDAPGGITLLQETGVEPPWPVCAASDRIWGRGRTRLVWRCQSPGKPRASCLAKLSQSLF